MAPDAPPTSTVEPPLAQPRCYPRFNFNTRAQHCGHHGVATSWPCQVPARPEPPMPVTDEEWAVADAAMEAQLDAEARPRYIGIFCDTPGCVEESEGDYWGTKASAHAAHQARLATLGWSTGPGGDHCPTHAAEAR